MTFHGKPRATKETFNQVHESPKVMTISLAILAIGTIFSGSILADFFIGPKQEVFWNHAVVLIHKAQHNIPFVKINSCCWNFVSSYVVFLQERFNKIIIS